MTVATIETTEYFSTAQAAEALDLDTDTVRRYCKNGAEGKTPALDGMQVGRAWLIHRDEIKRYKKERRDPGRPHSEK